MDGHSRRGVQNRSQHPNKRDDEVLWVYHWMSSCARFWGSGGEQKEPGRDRYEAVEPSPLRVGAISEFTKMLIVLESARQACLVRARRRQTVDRPALSCTSKYKMGHQTPLAVLRKVNVFIETEPGINVPPIKPRLPLTTTYSRCSTDYAEMAIVSDIRGLLEETKH